MTDIGHIGHQDPKPLWRRLAERFTAWRLDKVASPAFQRWAAAFPLTRPLVRADSAKIYDLVSGFVYSQTLLACVELGVLETLATGPASARKMAARHGLPERRMETLLQAAAAIGLVVRLRDGYRLGRLGAAVRGVPGLADMIRHHAVFYRDLSDPVALLKGETEPELSRFWSYVRGEGAPDPETARTYSALMASSQALVAEETLDAVPLTGRSLADIGGGTGVFLQHAADRYPDMTLHLFDLPNVVDAARTRLAGTECQLNMTGGSFLHDPLPTAETIALIRVLYDHDDQTVRTLLARVHAALPAGGRVLISEPMSGGMQPTRAGDAYFGFYTMAMTTGRPRSAERHIALLAEAGFTAPRVHPTRRPFLTSALTARKT